MISLMYRSFGRTSPENLAGFSYAATWVLALAFVASSLVMLAVFNFFALFFGVFVNFLGRDGVKFTFIHLFRRIPVIGIAPLVLIGYAIWQNAQTTGAGNLIVMPVVTALAAVGLIATVILFNSLRTGRRQSLRSQR